MLTPLLLVCMCARRGSAVPLEFIASDHDERHAWVVALAFVHGMFPTCTS